MEEELRGMEERPEENHIDFGNTEENAEKNIGITEEIWKHEPTSPYSPLYVPDKKKNNKITIGIIAVLLLVLLAGMIVAVSILVESAIGEVSKSVSSWKTVIEDFTEGMREPEDAPAKDWQSKDPGFEFELPDENKPYVPSPEDEYYVELADAIRYDLSYSVEKKEYTFSDENMGVNIYVQYVSVEGEELISQDKINEALEAGAMYYAKEFGASDARDFTLAVASYVTYMDENILSVVVDERYYYSGYSMTADLYCMNFDLKTGALLYNANIIDPSIQLAKAFIDMSEYQNGYVAYLDELTLEEVCKHFEDENALILYYTPVGLEIGLNYEDGWVSATLKDYEKYLSKL